MQAQKQAGSFNRKSADTSRLPASPFSAAASLMIALSENCLQMYAANVNMALSEISMRQREAMRAMQSAALLAYWPQSCLAKPAAIAAPGRTLFKADRRTSAVLINFPDRRKSTS